MQNKARKKRREEKEVEERKKTMVSLHAGKK
jgi:hypothetical protein